MAKSLKTMMIVKNQMGWPYPSCDYFLYKPNY